MYAPFTTPAYSNAGYALLAFALENITDKSFQDIVEHDLFAPLNMTSSFYNPPMDLSHAVLPGGAELSGFLYDYGNETPYVFTKQAPVQELTTI